jgi:predicted HTH domain antitoxin
MKIEINIPDGIMEKHTETDIKMYIAVGLYEKEILSSGHAAEAIGVNRAFFINNMANYGKSIFDLPEEEIEKDMENAGKYLR